MKIFGQVVDLTNYVETLVIPKGEHEFVFKARPVVEADYSEFDSLCAKPAAPVVFVPGGQQKVDEADATFLESLKKYRGYRTDFMFYKSLSATEGLEWDTVEADKPETWGNVQSELKAAGFLDQEIVMLYNCVIAANGLDGEKIRKATDSFLAMAGNQAL